VGVAGVEEYSDSVVGEGAESEADSFDLSTRLLTASVGPLLTNAWCKAVMWVFQRSMVRSRERTSMGCSGFLEVPGELVAELDG
jgi:hypothetical protein